MAFVEPKAPENASKLYKTLFATATEFIHCQDRDESRPRRMNLERTRAIRTSNHQHSFGHNYLVSTKPLFQGVMNRDQFLAHIGSMVPKLERWDAHITDIAVDETRKMCTVRASYFMKPLGVSEAVENDLIWWLWMEEGGQKVEKAVEFLDGVATGRIGELSLGVKKSMYR